MKGDWDAIGGQAPEVVTVDGVEIRRGSRVELMPRSKRDLFDQVLAGRTAVVQSIEEDVDGGGLRLTVTVDGDPGQDFGEMGMPGHRFFFGLDEVRPVAAAAGATAPSARVLVAGIGNVFLGDDGFGVEVVRRLADRVQPAGVDVVDYGIRGMELAYALSEYDAVILVDAAPRGNPPGTLVVLEPEIPDETVGIETHAMDPVRVLALARTLGGIPARTLVVACEPGVVMSTDPDEEVSVGLSPPVRAAVEEAVALIESQLPELLTNERRTA